MALDPRLVNSMHTQHSQAKVKLEKLKEIAARQKTVREQFSALENLGDLVTEEDVVASASKIVAAGVPPMAVASILSEMPQGSEALAAWVSGQEEQFRAKELQLEQALATTRYETGLAALRLLGAESFGGMEAPGESNPLAAQTPDLSPPSLGVDVSPGLAPSNDLMEE